MLYATGEAVPGAPPPSWRTALQMPHDALSVPAEWRPSLSAVHVTRAAPCRDQPPWRLRPVPSSSDTPRQRQTKLRAASSLGQSAEMFWLAGYTCLVSHLGVASAEECAWVVAEAEKHAAAAAGGWNDAGHHDRYPTCDVVVAESEALLGWVNLKLRGAIWPSLAAQFGVDADDLWLQARTRTACAPHAHRVCMARAWHVHVHSTCTAGALRVHCGCMASALRLPTACAQHMNMHAIHMHITGRLRRAVRCRGAGPAGDAHGRQRALLQPAAL